MTIERSGAVIVGAGLMGRWHAHAVRTLGRRVVAVVDADLRRAEALAHGVGGTATTELADALGRAPLVVHLCIPPASHTTLARAAIEAGAHLLVEKPFTPSASEASALLAMAQQAGLHIAPVHQFLFQRGFRDAMRRLPEYGPHRHVDFVACSAGAEGTSDTPARRAQLVRDILPHPLSLLRRVFGSTFAAARWEVQSPQPGEARIVGVVGATSVGLVISARGRPTRNSIRFVGERGTMDVDLFHGFATFDRGDVSRRGKVLRPFTHSASTFGAAAGNLVRRAVMRQPAYPGLRELVSLFHAAAETGGPAPIPAQETQDVYSAAEIIGARLAD